jgi:transcriptional regulator with GAF, ATPase, and Fis domain
VGADEILKTDVRVIAASNEDLKKMCDEGTYRKNLLTRNCVKIKDSALDAGISSRQLNKLMNRYGLRKIGRYSSWAFVLKNLDLDFMRIMPENAT